MTDYRRPVRFGVFLSPNATELDQSMQVAMIADTHDLDLIGVQDHPYQRRFLDTWMLMAHVLVGGFADEVAPAVRTAVEQARGRS